MLFLMMLTMTTFNVNNENMSSMSTMIMKIMTKLPKSNIVTASLTFLQNGQPSNSYNSSDFSGLFIKFDAMLVLVSSILTPKPCNTL